MAKREIECTILDAMYETDDYQVIIKLNIDKAYQFQAWDGLEWSDKTGLNRVYTDENSQHEYDDFISRLLELEESKILYEVAEELDEDQSYYFDKERLYLYIESKKVE